MRPWQLWNVWLASPMRHDHEGEGVPYREADAVGTLRAR